MTGLLFDVQHYAVHDGPGIRTLVFLKGCPLRCVWCCNPESQAPEVELLHKRSFCRACLRCAGVCPLGAVSEPPAGGTPLFDRSACARCDGRPCVENCWQGALAVAGSDTTVEALVARVAADLPFYRNSGGGVTFSGGEPFAQPAFLLAALEACREAGIHTAIETCGHADPTALVRSRPLVDLFLFDLKVADPERHRELTGVDNELILGNLARLSALPPEKLLVRVPFVPGLTDSPENLGALADIVSRLGITRVGLQPYHSFGGGKYAELGRDYAMPPGAPSFPDLAAAEAVFRSRGLACESP